MPIELTSVINEVQSNLEFTVRHGNRPVSLDGDKRSSDWPIDRNFPKYELWDLRFKVCYGFDPICPDSNWNWIFWTVPPSIYGLWGSLLTKRYFALFFFASYVFWDKMGSAGVYCFRSSNPFVRSFPRIVPKILALCNSAMGSIQSIVS